MKAIDKILSFPQPPSAEETATAGGRNRGPSANNTHGLSGLACRPKENDALGALRTTADPDVLSRRAPISGAPQGAAALPTKRHNNTALETPEASPQHFVPLLGGLAVDAQLKDRGQKPLPKLPSLTYQTACDRIDACTKLTPAEAVQALSAMALSVPRVTRLVYRTVYAREILKAAASIPNPQRMAVLATLVPIVSSISPAEQVRLIESLLEETRKIGMNEVKHEESLMQDPARVLSGLAKSVEKLTEGARYGACKAILHHIGPNAGPDQFVRHMIELIPAVLSVPVKDGDQRATLREFLRTLGSHAPEVKENFKEALKAMKGPNRKLFEGLLKALKLDESNDATRQGSQR